MLPQATIDALASLSRTLEGVDVDCYARHERDPSLPLLGLGPRDARLCLIGRDPGASEIEQWRPFVGPAGRKIREALAGHRDDRFFWFNTVPYKPVGNKAWPLGVRRRFHAVLLPLLLQAWDGHDVVTFGKEAFEWFGLEQAPDVRAQVAAFWLRADRFESSLELELASGAMRRTLVLHPLPHPSPANAQWKGKFVDLLARRVETLLPA